MQTNMGVHFSVNPRFLTYLLAYSYRPYLVRVVRKVGHGSGQTALCSQYAGVAG